MSEVDRRCDDMVVDAVRGRWFEGREAHRADALVDLARPDSAAPAGPDSMIHVMVDYDALMRGHTVAGTLAGAIAQQFPDQFPASAAGAARGSDLPRTH